MSDNPQFPDESLEFEAEDNVAGEEDSTEAIFIRREPRPATRESPDPSDLGWLFVCWSWAAGYRSWNDGLWALVRALRGLEEIGLLQRCTIKRPGYETHHGFVLTDEGREAVIALSGDWIRGADR